MRLVISGGQTGADQAAWRAAKRCGIATGGYMPKGFLTEDGPHPELAELYGAKESHSVHYPVRTEQNVVLAHATVWLGPGDSSGFYCTQGACGRNERRFLVMERLEPRWAPLEANRLLSYTTVNFAGSRESKRPGIGEQAEAFLVELFKARGHAPDVRLQS